ncbi:hypothetical protein ZIOFF_009410 [Zingiber officinale]|uniref:Uncharacterized protein n=1 Tax=Zingiber officinale TaxID=94328 RepID=A0A8J5LJD2_ZINOF|nr:hypothetical protein ZIOFF_009410 [Zingiber officinale]
MSRTPFLKYDEIGFWVQDYALMFTLSKEVPRFLILFMLKPCRFYCRCLKEIEKILFTGTALTVVGETAKDDAGKESLIANLCNRWYQIASTGFTVVGIFLLTKHALQHVLEKRRCWELQKRVLAVARQAYD